MKNKLEEMSLVLTKGSLCSSVMVIVMRISNPSTKNKGDVIGMGFYLLNGETQ